MNNNKYIIILYHKHFLYGIMDIIIIEIFKTYTILIKTSLDFVRSIDVHALDVVVVLVQPVEDLSAEVAHDVHSLQMRVHVPRQVVPLFELSPAHLTLVLASLRVDEHVHAQHVLAGEGLPTDSAHEGPYSKMARQMHLKVVALRVHLPTLAAHVFPVVLRQQFRKTTLVCFKLLLRSEHLLALFALELAIFFLRCISLTTLVAVVPRLGPEDAAALLAGNGLVRPGLAHVLVQT